MEFVVGDETGQVKLITLAHDEYQSDDDSPHKATCPNHTLLRLLPPGDKQDREFCVTSQSWGSPPPNLCDPMTEMYSRSVH